MISRDPPEMHTGRVPNPTLKMTLRKGFNQAYKIA
jgi:hypothetical protein